MHCYQKDKNPQPEHSRDELLEILKLIDFALSRWGKIGTISLTGGEPFLRRDELFSLMEKMDSLSSIGYYDILSNGSLIDEHLSKELSKLKKIRRIQFSLEGASKNSNDAIRGEGSFDETINAIRKIKAKEIQVSIMTTITRANKDEILKLIKILDKEKVDTFAIERLIPEGRGANLKDQMLSKVELKDLYERIYQVANNNNSIRILFYRPLFALIDQNNLAIGAICSAGMNTLTIMPDGTVYPCRRLPIPIGNVLKEGFFKIWYGSDILWNIRNPDNIKGKCRDCELLPACRGCRAMAYFTTGDYMGEDPQCWK